MRSLTKAEDLSSVMPDLIRHPATARLRRETSLYAIKDLIALDPDLIRGDGERIILSPESSCFPAYTFVTKTVTIGFLPQLWLAAARTARRTASRSNSRSLRRARGMLSTAPSTAS